MKGVQVMSIHIGAKEGDIAETVLLPGDPKRAKWIAENYFRKILFVIQILEVCQVLQVHIKGKRYLYKEQEWEFLQYLSI